jgi:hypothetical protein
MQQLQQLSAGMLKKQLTPCSSCKLLVNQLRAANACSSVVLLLLLPLLLLLLLRCSRVNELQVPLPQAVICS